MLAKNNTKARKKFKAAVGELSQNAQDYIESLQPYHLGAAAEGGSLWVLHAPWNRDKHSVVNAAVGSIEFKVPKDPRVSFEVVESDATWVVSFPTELASELNYTPEVEASVTFEMAGPGAGDDIGALRGVHDYIRDSLLPAFAKFFA